MKYLFVYLVIGVLVYGGFLYFRQLGYQTNPKQETIVEEETKMITDETGVKVVNVSGANFRFDPATITVKKGDQVRIVFKSLDMMHDFNLDELGVDGQVVPAGETDTVEFVASQTGEFEYYCSVGQHRANGMVGTLIVE